MEKVSYSDWAAPIVVVPKQDGSYRLCGDYKVTVNQALGVDQYPLPKPEDLLATLAVGQKFTKLDLRQAYQHLRLDDQSKSFTNINTHKGLYRYICSGHVSEDHGCDPTRHPSGVLLY